jgi:hypothetical protein
VRGRKGGEVEAHSTASHAGTEGKWGRRGARVWDEEEMERAWSQHGGEGARGAGEWRLGLEAAARCSTRCERREGPAEWRATSPTRGARQGRSRGGRRLTSGPGWYLKFNINFKFDPTLIWSRS